MTKKDLCDIRFSKILINSYEKELENLQNDIFLEKRSGNRSERVLKKMHEYKVLLEKEKQKLQDAVNNINDEINAIPNKDYKTVLYLRYIKNYSFDKIAIKMYCDRSTVFRYIKKALCYIERDSK